MSRKLINSGLRFRVAMAAVAVGMLVFGLTQLPKAPVDVYPEFAPLMIEVQTEALGLSSVEVEQLITVPLEADLLNGVAWVEDIRSASVPGLSSITLTFEPGTDLYRARQAVQERLAQALAIPHVSKPPQMLQPVSSTSRTMLIALSSRTMSLIDISQLARWTIKPRLMGVEGVANVSSFGQRERQLQVQVDPQRLTDNGVTLLQVVETAGNALWVSPLSFLEASTPGTGGFIETPSQRLGVRHVSPIESAADLAQVVVAERPLPDGTLPDRPPLRLGDIATVVEDHQPLIGDAVVDGGAGVVLVVEKLRGSNTVEVTRGVEAALADLQTALGDLKVDASVYRPADYIEASSGNVGRAMTLGLLLMIVVLAFAFLQWRLALVSVAAVVASLATAAALLDVLGYAFNAMTLAGLALAVGIVVDDAVVGTERVARGLRDAGSRSIAATIADTSLQVRSALAYATVFVLLPLLPVAFAGNLLGAFGRPLALAYCLAVLASMVVALLVTPALCLLLLPKAAHAGQESALVSRVGPRYTSGLDRLLAAPRQAVVLGVLALVGLAVAAVALPQLRQASLPDLDERDLMVTVDAAPGTSLARTKEITTDLSGKVRSVGGVRNVVSHAGRAVTGDQVVDVSSSILWVSLDASADALQATTDIERILDGYPDITSAVTSYQGSRVEQAGAAPEAPIVVRVYGNEQHVLADRAREVGQELAKIDGIDDLRVDLPVSEPTLEVTVNLAKAGQFGVKPGDVRRAAAILLSGIDVGQLFYDQKVFDVVVWATPANRENADDVRNLLIETPSGPPVRLQDVADVALVESPDVIDREGVFRKIDVTAQVSGRSRAAVASEVEKAIAALPFPLEYRAELLGDFTAHQAQERRVLILSAFAGLAMLLVLQAGFGNWRLGAAFFLSLPLSLAGGVVAARAQAGDVTIGAAVGLLAVLGVAARSGILLVKRYQEMERRDGHVLGATLVVRGARERLLPTLLTAAAVAVAFLPVVAIGRRPGTELLHPMGIVILGGLVTATLVTLFVVPMLYLSFAGTRSDTELDVGQFEDELLLMDAAGNLDVATSRSVGITGG